MENGDDDDAIFACVIEQGIGEAMKQHAPKRSVDYLERQWSLSSQGECIVNPANEIVSELS